jgi:NADPH:quinone reductase-like Zn-dependent oxidoreductase
VLTRLVTFATTSLGTTIGTKLSEIFELAAAGKLVPMIDKTFPLADAALSHELKESGNVFGKIALTV